MKLNQLWRVSLPDVVRCFFTIYFLLSKRRFVHSIPFQQKDSLKLKPHKEKFHASNQITGNHLRGDDPQVRRVIRALIRSQNATSFITQLFCHWEIQNGLNKLIPRIYNKNRSAAYCVFVGGTNQKQNESLPGGRQKKKASSERKKKASIPWLWRLWRNSKCSSWRPKRQRPDNWISVEISQYGRLLFAYWRMLRSGE
jgi:hypothetical protein